MKKIAEELEDYPNTFKAFKKYLASIYQFDIDKFVKDSSNAQLLPQLFLFLETECHIDIIDVLVYTNFNTKNSLNFNDLCKKSVKVVFFMIENEKEMNFTIF